VSFFSWFGFLFGDGVVSSVTSLPMVRDWGGWMEAAWHGRLVRGRTAALRLGLKFGFFHYEIVDGAFEAGVGLVACRSDPRPDPLAPSRK